MDGFYTNIHDGKPSTLDHILLSRHFFRMPTGIEDANFKQRYFFDYYEVQNDHLVDQESPFAPHKPATSDHGVAVAYLKKSKIAPAIQGVTALKAPESRSDLEIR